METPYVIGKFGGEPFFNEQMITEEGDYFGG